MFTIDQESNQMTIVMKDTASFDVGLDNYTLRDGDSVTFTIAETKESQEPILQKVVTEFEDGIATVEISSEDSNIPAGSYYYDIQINLSDGRVDTVIGPAKFKVIEGVTY